MIDGELITIDTDLEVFKVQREQLATMDLHLLTRQAIDISDLSARSMDQVLAYELTINRIKNNLVAGAMAVAELELLKKT